MRANIILLLCNFKQTGWNNVLTFRESFAVPAHLHIDKFGNLKERPAVLQ